MDQLYQLYMKDIYRYLLFLSQDHHAAEDLLQETFYRAYLYLENYNGEKVKPWLLRVAHNAFIDYKRKEKRSRPFDPEVVGGLEAEAESPEAIMVRREQLGEIGSAIAGLPEKQRQALLLHDWEELTYQEAADIMAVGLSHFKVLLFRARQRLRQLREGGDMQ